MENGVVPMGKYKGQPIERLLADQPYTDWLLAQAWFLDRYADLAEIMRSGRLAEPQDTPEHNAMIAGLIDQRDAMECLLVERVGSGDLEWFLAGDMQQELEPKGGDLLVRICVSSALIEAKPLIGDDYPSVIRQVKAGLSSGLGIRGVVIARKVEPTNLTLDQVRRQFELAGVRLILESEFFAAGAKWANDRAAYISKTIKAVEAEIAAETSSLAELQAHPIIDDGWRKSRGWEIEERITKANGQIARLNNRLATLREIR